MELFELANRLPLAMRNPLNLEVPLVQRTLRELLLIAGGAAFTMSAVLRHEPWLFVGIYAFATLVFAARFFPARAFAVATSIAAIVQTLVVFRFDVPWRSWVFYVPFAVLAGMLSRDLTKRFDRAPSPMAWMPNRWAALPETHARRLRICAYAVATQAAAIVASPFAEATAAKVAMTALWALLLLLVLGRAMAVLLAPFVTMPVAYFWAAEFATRRDLLFVEPAVRWSLEGIGPLCAGIACAVALAYFRQFARIVRQSV